MTLPFLPQDHPRVRLVGSFQELLTTPFAGDVNALCWPRVLEGNFAEVADQLRSLPLSEAGRLAVETMVQDLNLLLEQDLDPELNSIRAYPREEAPGPVATDVMSFHVDSATDEADTWLCTYQGACSEGLENEQAVPRADVPETRARLLELYGGMDDEGFQDYLAENCYDLHYAPLPGARPYSFGVGHLWRIATDWPGSPVLPCIHRAPETRPGDPVRLLLIS
jgi:hypothetical protein